MLMRKGRVYSEVYNDLDGEVVNLFRHLRDEEKAKHLREALRLTPFARTEFMQAYEPSNDEFERARRLVIRSFMGFGSNGHEQATGFRANSNRSGTTPAHDWMHYPDSIDAMADRLKGVVIESRDASEVMQAHDSPQTLHYVDPPYVPETRDKGSDYAHEMTVEQHEALLTALRQLDGMVILSGYPCDIYEDHLSDWHRVERGAYADGARERREVLWISRNAVRQPGLFGGHAA